MKLFFSTRLKKLFEIRLRQWQASRREPGEKFPLQIVRCVDKIRSTYSGFPSLSRNLSTNSTNDDFQCKKFFMQAMGLAQKVPRMTPCRLRRLSPFGKGENTALEFAGLIVPLEKGDGRGAAGGRSHTMSYPFFVQSQAMAKKITWKQQRSWG